MATPSKTPNRLWIVILAVLAVLLIAWLLDPSGDADDNLQDAASLPQDGYVEAPAGPTVPAELPTAVPTVGEPAISATPSPATPAPAPMPTLAPTPQTPAPQQ